MEGKALLSELYAALEDKKAHDIRILDIRGISSVGDYFVICDGSNKNQLDAIADLVEEKMSKAGARMKHKEGTSNGGWLLLDYYDIIVHVMTPEMREFYNLEHIWRDANQIDPGDL